MDVSWCFEMKATIQWLLSCLSLFNYSMTLVCLYSTIQWLLYVSIQLFNDSTLVCLSSITLICLYPFLVVSYILRFWNEGNCPRSLDGGVTVNVWDRRHKACACDTKHVKVTQSMWKWHKACVLYGTQRMCMGGACVYMRLTVKSGYYNPLQPLFSWCHHLCSSPDDPSEKESFQMCFWKIVW